MPSGYPLLRLRWWVLWSLLALLAACTYPRDPESTTERVLTTGTIRVGVSENAPWVRKVDGQPAGVEVDLVEEFAETLQADIVWVWGPANAHLEALGHYHLDLMIGGVTDATPWRREVALTNPYFRQRIQVGARAAQPGLEEIDSVPVAVPVGSVLAEYVAQQDGIPVPMEHPEQADILVAGPHWQLPLWGLTPLPVNLHDTHHVMAVPPGENRWLIRLDRFLQSYTEEQMVQRLQEEARR